MKLLFENWRKFLEDGIDPQTKKPDYKYYAFDWDDNIVRMPTKIILMSEEGEEIGMGTSDFADYRGLIGEENFSYGDKTITGFADNAFRNFRVEGDEQFLSDAMRAETGPSWEDFTECINGGSIFAIITARGHNPETLRKGVEQYINNNFQGIEREQVVESLKSYREAAAQSTYDEPGVMIEEYLDKCKFYPVSYGEGSAVRPEQAKRDTLTEFISYVKGMNPDMKIQVGFSDDDLANIEFIRKSLEGEEDLIIKHTGPPEEEKNLT